ncbi:ORF123 [Staphylococcus phage EW]|uniref:ORF123 n=1 Tax=Staphylococcus phage EW TaxID=2936814 RepID=Q4ZC27_9CAUD|nr:ORF123 [Staphylococcus phage EW]AAX91406.1 ORF123 [Staphylococcus phage EW]
MGRLLALVIAMITTFVVATPFAFEAYFTTTIFVAILTMITSYYASKYVISA